MGDDLLEGICRVKLDARLREVCFYSRGVFETIHLHSGPHAVPVELRRVAGQQPALYGLGPQKAYLRVVHIERSAIFFDKNRSQLAELPEITIVEHRLGIRVKAIF